MVNPVRKLMQLCCIALLLFAQQMALTHSTWHAAGAHAAQAPSDHDHPQAPQGHTGAEHELCVYHAAFCEVTGGNCAGGAHGAAIVKAPAERAPRAIARQSAEAIPAVSRGPPGPA